jgi:tetratricopeptide (TPR) repeat protein
MRIQIAAALLAASLGAGAQAPAPGQPQPQPQPQSQAPASVPESLTMRAARRLQAGDVQGALADANLAILRDSRASGAYALRGSIRMTAGDRAGALLDMSRAIELAPGVQGIEIVHTNRANVYWLEGRNKEAMADVEQALKLKPDFGLALHVRARIRADEGDLDGALKDLDTAIKAEPKMMPAYMARAAVNMQAGRLQESLSDYKTLMWSLPNDSDVVASHGVVRGLLGETEAGVNDLLKARAMNRLSVSDQDRGRGTSPLERLDQYREMNPNDGRALIMRAAFSAMNGQEDRAVKELDEAVRVQPALKADADKVRARINR